VMAIGAATGGKKAYDSYKEGHGWSALAEGGLAATSLLPFASKKNLSGMFGAEARAQTMQTVRQGGSRLFNGAKDFGVQAWGGLKNLAASEGMSGVKALGTQAWSGARNLGTKAVNGVKNLGAQAWSGARDWGAKAWSGAKNLGDRAVIGAKNVGIRAANERDNLIYQAKVLEAKLSPAMATPEGIPLRPMPEPPTQRPLIPVPEKQKPLMMQGNNPDGSQGTGGTSATPGKTPQTSRASSPSATKPATAEEAERMNPHDIRFSQDTVSPNFSDGGTLTDVVGQLRSGQLSANKFPTIRIVEHNGKIYSLDNRRLSAFKAAQLEDIPVQRLELSDPAVRAEFLKKFKPINDGWNNVVVPAAGRAEARRILREYGKYDPN
jgi:hypothetical protein